MPDRLQIWNGALSRIGAGDVLADLADPSTAGNEIRRQYPSEVLAMFEEHRWKWATRTVALTSFEPVPPGAQYAYQFPPECAGIVKIALQPQPDAPSVPWWPGGATSPQNDELRLILSDQARLYATFVKIVRQEAVWPNLFAKAMEWRLAHAIGFVINRDMSRREEARVGFLEAMEKAKAEDQRQGYQRPVESEWIRAREGDYLAGEIDDEYPATRYYPVA